MSAMIVNLSMTTDMPLTKNAYKKHHKLKNLPE
jgi:hypothetical protein